MALDGDGSAFRIHKTMLRLAPTDHFVGLVPHDVDQFETGRRTIPHADFDGHCLREFAGPEIFHRHRNHRRNIPLFFHCGITPADLIKEIHPGLLHPADVVGMVNDPHAVGFVVFDIVRVYFHDRLQIFDFKINTIKNMWEYYACVHSSIHACIGLYMCV